MSRSDIVALLLQGIALALLVLLIAVAPAAAAGGVLLSGSPPLQRLLPHHSRRACANLAPPFRIDRSTTSG